MRVLLLSTYELGHQPLHLASPAGALTRAGHEVRCLDLAVETLDPPSVQWADAVAVSVPMHTALQLARDAITSVRRHRRDVPVWLYGLYAGVDDGSDHGAGSDVRVIGEYEAELVALADDLAEGHGDAPAPAQRVRVRLDRQRFGLPARRLVPPLDRYARLLVDGEERVAGYVEASHGCAHRCRHCPVPVVYDGRTRLVGVEDVLADVAQLVGLGARHVTFGDPDFLNGPQHSRRVLAAVHHAFPDLTFDVTAKVSHVLAHRHAWPEMASMGCLFVVSAFESASDELLALLDKGHTCADEVEAVEVLRSSGIEPRPSLLPFTPWTTPADLADLVELVERCDLVGNVDPVQWSIRLLVPPGSLLLDGDALEGRLGPYDPEHLTWSWRSADPRLDELQGRLAALAERAGSENRDPGAAHDALRREVCDVLGSGALRPIAAALPTLQSSLEPGRRPRLSEAWFCCAEPSSSQRRGAPSTTTPLSSTAGVR